MTTTDTNRPAWLEELAPAARRVEIDALVARIGQATEELAPVLGRARELLAELELQERDARLAAGDAGYSVAEMLSELSGNQALFNALADLEQQCDPTYHPLYAALVNPGHLRIDSPIVLTNPEGVEVQGHVCNFEPRAEGWKMEAFDVQNPGIRWEIEQADLIAGVRRGLAVMAQAEDEG